ncbi:hypothetical protein KR059_008136 [Drosophila kikkawai]|nr:hypothetical protein KR059_008136 [Drosophila kikkawai]
MALSRKEIIAILLLITALLNVLNATYFANIVHLHSSYEQVAHQVVCVGTAYICVIYALSTWLYHSNYHRSRQEMRFVLATMLLLMIVSHCVSTYFFREKMAFKGLSECTDLRSLFTSMTNVAKMISLVLSIICILLLCVALLMVLFKTWRSRKKRAKAEFKESA